MRIRTPLNIPVFNNRLGELKLRFPLTEIAYHKRYTSIEAGIDLVTRLFAVWQKDYKAITFTLLGFGFTYEKDSRYAPNS